MSSTLPRVPELEAMTDPAEAATYDAMDHSAVNSQFVQDVLQVAANSANTGLLARVLDLGTGTAQIPVLLCRSDPRVRVMAADLSMAMLELARRNIEIASLIDRIQLDYVDANALPYADGQFTAVISNSIVHHVRDPQNVLREAARVTQPEGFIFFRDLARPSDEDELRRLVDQYTAADTEIAGQLFADSLRAAYTVAEMRDMVRELGFAEESVQATSDRHWTWSVVARRSPS